MRVSSRSLVCAALALRAGTCAVRYGARATLLSDSLVRYRTTEDDPPPGRGKAGVNAVGGSFRDRGSSDG